MTGPVTLRIACADCCRAFAKDLPYARALAVRMHSVFKMNLVFSAISLAFVETTNWGCMCT